MKKLYLLKFTLLFFATILNAQQNVNELIKEVKSASINYLPDLNGTNKKGDSIVKLIDTTVVEISQIDRINLLSNFVDAENPKQAFVFPLTEWALNNSRSINYKKGIAESAISLGNYYRRKSDIICRDYYKEALEVYIEENDIKNSALAKSCLGLSYYFTTEYDIAIDYFLEVLNDYKRIKNYDGVSTTYHNLGDTYISAQDTINAIKNFKLSMEIEKSYPEPSVAAMNTNFLGQIYLKMGGLDIAEEHFLKSNNIVNTEGVLPYLYIYNSIGLGEIEKTKGNIDNAYVHFESAFKNSYNIPGVKGGNNKAGLHLVEILIQKTNFDDALKILNLLEDNIRSFNDDNYKSFKIKSFKNVYNQYSNLYEKVEDYKKAYAYKIKAEQFQKELGEIEVTKKIKEVEGKYASENKEKQILELKKENKSKKKQLVLSIISGIPLIVLILFGFIYYREREKSLKRKVQISQLQLSNQQILAKQKEQEKELIELDIKLKDKELTTNAISLIQKKEQYSLFLKRLEEIKTKLKGKEIIEIDKLISECKSSLITYNWDEFKITFEKVHSDFYKKILEVYPNLTSNEKKICAFLKLGMSTKDIASITMQTSHSILIARTRLRKKMNLNKEDNLTTIISNY